MDDYIKAQWLHIEYMRKTLDYNITLIPLTLSTSRKRLRGVYKVRREDSREKKNSWRECCGSLSQEGEDNTDKKTE
jgi:hypothetical protein